MIIRIVRITVQNCWYSDCIGQKFYAFIKPELNLVWFSNYLFFYPEDIEVVNKPSGPGWIPLFPPAFS